MINRIDDVYNDDTGTWGPNERENIENIAGPAAKSLFEKFSETVQDPSVPIRRSLITKALTREEHTLKSPEAYTKPFCDFLTENPTVFHAVDYFEKKLEKAGYKKVRVLVQTEILAADQRLVVGTEDLERRARCWREVLC